MTAGQELPKEEMLAKIENNQESVDDKIVANQEKMEVRIEANNKHFYVLRGTPVSRMDIHQTRQCPFKKMRKPRWTYMKRRWRPR
jgi:hypothetical protein